MRHPTFLQNMFMDLGSAAGVAVAQLLGSRAPSSPTGSCPTVAVQDTNITAVQNVLMDVYGQRLHGQAPRVPNVTAWYMVTGAGSPEWDGYYVATDEVDNARVVYRSNASTRTRALYSYASVWRLGVEGDAIFYVAGTPTTGPAPPLTGWTVANGTGPAPTLLAAPPTQL
jgi:hypothetical protein